MLCPTAPSATDRSACSNGGARACVRVRVRVRVHRPTAFPPLTFPPHRPASRLRSTLLGQPSAAAQTRAAHRRAEELRQVGVQD
jgi:hypothetical protein